MPEGRAYKPGDTYTLDGTEFVVGADYEWHPNTSMAGQAAQGVMVDAPVGLLSLAQGALNLGGKPYRTNPAIGGSPDAEGFNFVPSAQGFYERNAQRFGVNPVPPQTKTQEWMRLGAQIPIQVGLGMASGGTSIPAEIAGATGGSIAAKLTADAGGGGVSQFGAGVVGDLLSRRPPLQTVRLVRDTAFNVRNARMIRAMELIQPLDLADEGASSLMKQVDAAHTTARSAMDAGYARAKGSRYEVSARHLAKAAGEMIEEAGDVHSPRLAQNLYVQIQTMLKDGKGVVTFDRLRALQKDANALLDTTDPARTGLAQQQGQIRGILIPAIQQTMDDMVRLGQSQATSPNPHRGQLGAKMAVDQLRAANKLASDYYTSFDKRSSITKELVDGIMGGQTLDPQKAFRKIFSDPKKQVDNARAVMEIVGQNPKNAATMRRAFVESVVSPDPSSFSAASALSQLQKQKPAAVEILGANGYRHFYGLLEKVKKGQVAAGQPSKAAFRGRMAGGVIGVLTNLASPFEAGLVGAAVGDVSGRTWAYLNSHFGATAAQQLAMDAIYNPQVAALLHANPRRLGQARLNQEFRTALVRTGFRFGTTNPTPMLPSEQRSSGETP